jgi:hypothetical protein
LNPNGLRSSSDFRERPTTTATSFIHTTTTAFVSANPAAADNNPTTRDGLFRKGCVTVIVVGLIFLAGLVGCSWYLYAKTINTLTSSAPADIRVEPPTDAQYQAADSSLTRLREAIDQDT